MILIAAPALPLDEAGKYVAGAYVVFVALLVIYLAIMSARLSRIDRELGELTDLADLAKGPAQGVDAGARGEAAVRAAEPAATLAPKPGRSAAEGEHPAGGVLRDG